MPVNNFNVTNNCDSGDGSLRQAVLNANSANTTDIQTITITCSVQSPITLCTQINITSNIQLINDSGNDITITINQSNPPNLSDPANMPRIFLINGSATYLKIVSTGNNKIYFTNGYADLGGAFFISNTHILLLYKVIFKNNTASVSGGAIYTNGKIRAYNSAFTSNSASIIGGAIYSALDVNLYYCTINKNSINADGSNPAPVHGAAVYIQKGNLILDNTQVTKNTLSYNSTPTTPSFGGTIQIETGTAYVHNGSSVSNNTAYNYAGILVINGGIHINSSTISGNLSTDTTPNGTGGAGVFCISGILHISDSTIKNNTSNGFLNGGAALFNGTAILNNTQITNNVSNGPGGAIHAILGSVSASNCVFSNNKAVGLGGAIAIFNPLNIIYSLTVYNCTIESNVVNNARSINDIIQQVNEYLSYNPNPTTIPNLPSQQFIVGGGAIGAIVTKLSIIKSTLNNNVAGVNVQDQNFNYIANGGGIYGFKSDVNTAGSTLSNNSTTTNGGAIWSNSYIFTSLSNLLNNTAGNNGGAINNGKTNSIEVNNTSITGNTAGKFGGGINSNSKNYSFNLVYATVQNNTANNGGGLAVSAKFTRFKADVTGNTPNNVYVKGS